MENIKNISKESESRFVQNSEPGNKHRKKKIERKMAISKYVLGTKAKKF